MPTIQRLLGHRALSTTSRYFHLAHPTLLAHRLPLDLLDGPATPAPITAQADRGQVVSWKTLREQLRRSA